MEWKYESLLSCPSILILGYFETNSINGVVMFPVLNYRFNILKTGNEERLLNNIPEQLMPEKISSLCLDIMCGKIDHERFLDKAFIKTMFYGGYNIFLDIDGDALPLVIDFIDIDNYLFLLRRGSVSIKGFPKTSLDNWVLLGVALRTSNKKLFGKACTSIGGRLYEDSGICELNTPHGLLSIILKNNREYLWDREKFLRIIPDNNPLRHIINYDLIKSLSEK
jgi:hypothetical protein